MVETKVSVTGTCLLCCKKWEVQVPANEYIAWKQGALIQDAMPNLEPQQRELLISGICPECWERYMKPLDDDDEEIEL